MSGLWDPGLQPERTELAWRRTSLSLAIGSLVSLRLLPDALGSAIWVFPGFVGVFGAGLMWWSARRRYKLITRTLAQSDHAGLPDGRLLIAPAIFVLAGGAAGLAVVVISSTHG